jgi:bla regulator protein BlaR1
MDCRVIKDLIPMYIEQLTSEPSNDLVTEHIAGCEDCRRTLARLMNDFTIENPGNEKSPIDAVPIQLVKRIKKNILEKTIILASIALAAGILIGILSSSPVMFMAFMGSISIFAFTASIFFSIAVCRKTSSMRKKYQRVGNWTFLFSLIVSCLLFVLFRGFFNEFAKSAIILCAVIIYNLVFSSTLRIYARMKLPKDDAVAVESANRRLYCVAFCTLLALTLLIAVPITVLEKNRTVDNIDLPFEDDPDLIGRWRSVDFVKSPEQFVPGKRASNGPLFLEEMSFLGAGKMKMVIDNPEGRRNADVPRPWLSWTKGVVLHKGGDHTASKYILRELEGTKYLFFEWKSGDAIYFHLPPQYYVLEKKN